MALLHDYLKQQQSQNDVWTTREQLCLTSAVVKNGDQNWVAVSRTCRALTSETNRPADWYSTKNCAFQYAKLLEKIDINKRRREMGDSNLNETMGETATKILAAQLIEELGQTMTKQKHSYEKLLNHINTLESGQYDDRIDEIWEEAMEDQRKNDEEEKVQEEWMKQRSERLLAMQRPSTSPTHKLDPQSSTISQEAVNSEEEFHPDCPILPTLNTETVVKVEEIVENIAETVIKTEVVEADEYVQSPDELQSEPQNTQLETVTEPYLNEADDNVNEESLQSADVQTNLTLQGVVKIEPEIIADDTPTVEPISLSSTAELENTPESDQDAVNLSPKRVDGKKSSQESADDIYAFDSDPESSEKKGIPSFSLIRDEPKKTDKYETFKSSRKRMRNLKESHSCTGQDEIIDKDETAEITVSSSEDFEPPKKVRRLTKREDEDKKKIVEPDDDEVSRDSAEVKEILMFVKSDRRRVYGHDDTASPVISESTPSSPASTYYGDDCESEKIYKTWKKSIMLVWNDIAAHKNASVFLRSISDEKVPGYHSIVYKPTDLQAIKRQIEMGVLRTSQEFQREILILFLNAKMYNPKDHNISQMAQEMMKDCIATIEEFNNTQLMAKSMDSPQKSLRRETRESSAKRSEVAIKRKRK